MTFKVTPQGYVLAPPFSSAPLVSSPEGTQARCSDFFTIKGESTTPQALSLRPDTSPERIDAKLAEVRRDLTRLARDGRSIALPLAACSALFHGIALFLGQFDPAIILGSCAVLSLLANRLQQPHLEGKKRAVMDRCAETLWREVAQSSPSNSLPLMRSLVEVLMGTHESETIRLLSECLNQLLTQDGLPEKHRNAVAWDLMLLLKVERHEECLAGIALLSPIATTLSPRALQSLRVLLDSLVNQEMDREIRYRARELRKALDECEAASRYRM